jgi:hypothetical protein
MSLSDPAITSTGSPQIARSGSVACPSTSVCYLVGDDDSGSGYVVTTTDSGSTWNPLILPLGTDSLSGIACPPPSTSSCYVTGSENSGAFILATTNSGDTWSNVSVPTGLVSVSGIACPSLTTCYLIGYDPAESDPEGGSVIADTTDSGSSWNILTIPADFGPTGPIACATTDTCYAVGNDGDPNQDFVLATTDSGAMWVQQGTPPDTSGIFGSAIACPSATNCYLSAYVSEYRFNGFKIFSTSDSGNTWIPQSLPNNTGALSAIACPSTSECFGAGTTSVDGGADPGVGDIVVTTDSGGHWSGQIIPTGTSFLSSAVCPSVTVCFAQASAIGTRGAVVLKGAVLNIATASLPDGTIGAPYLATLTATGGDPPYHWRMAPGSPTLPKGLRLGTKSGSISGKPSKTSSSSTFTVEVQDTKSKTSPPVLNTATTTLTITLDPTT